MMSSSLMEMKKRMGGTIPSGRLLASSVPLITSVGVVLPVVVVGTANTAAAPQCRVTAALSSSAQFW